jgi:dienelactone hydrolase
MKSLRCVAFVALAVLVLTGVARGASPSGTVIQFSSLDPSQHYTLSGTLYLPDKIPAPAIVMVHGTSGIGVTGVFYREVILGAGIAIFEVDFRSGIYKNAMDRPPVETFVPMAFAALKELRKLPSIDPQRIGIMGFSMGGGVALQTALESSRKHWVDGDKGFATVVGFYPICMPLIPVLQKSTVGFTGVPMMILYGSDDVYGDGQAVPELKHLLAKKFHFDLETVEYQGAAHGFNRNGPPVMYHDPAAIGGNGYMAWDEGAAEDSKGRVVEFLQRTLVTHSAA